MKNLFKLLIFSFIAILSSMSVSAQNAFTNPSFEGPQGMGIVPAPWIKCMKGTSTTTPDTQPNQFGITMPPSDGNTYISVLSGNSTATPEALSQNLFCPLKAGNRYSFTIDIAFDSANFGGALEIWAGMGTCTKTQLLASLTPTANNVWQKKTVTFIATSNWTSITFTGKTITGGSKFILFDNLSPIMRTGPSGGATLTTTNASCDGLGNNDGSATVTAPADGTAWQYNWSPGGQTTPTITDLAPGTYTCLITDPTDPCSPMVVKATIYGPLPLTVTATPATICSGQTSQLQVSVQEPPPPSCAYTLRLYKNGSAWAAPSNVKVYLNGVLSGTYAKNNTAIFQDFSFNVTQGDAIQLEYTATGVPNGDQFHYFQLHDVYFGMAYNTTTADMTVSGVKWNGVATCGFTPPTYTYSWTPSATLSNATIANPVASPTITTTYEVSVTSSNSPVGCPTKKQVTVTVSPASAITLTSAVATTSQIICQNIAITDIAYGLTNVTSASVTGLPIGVIGTYASGIFTISGTPTESGTFNYTVTSSGGCAPDATATGTITVTPQSIITLTSAAATSNQTVCQNTAISAITYSITDATGATVTGLPIGVNGTYASGVFTISGTPTGSGTFNYTVTTSGDCNVIATGTISVNPTITPAFTQVTPICSGSTLAALPTTSNEGITGTWSPALNNTTTTTYTFTPDAGQCAVTNTMTITVTPNVTPTFATVTPICSGSSLAALPTTSNEGITGTWSPTLDNTTTTTYTFTPDAGQCASTGMITITVNASTTPTFTTVDPICSGESFTFPSASNEGITGTWSPAFDNTTTTTYTFTPDAGQCASTEMMIIEIRNDCEIPKGISPNGDNLNDVLDLSNFNITKLSIFNRYGMAAYTHGFGYKNQWYGQSNSGQELPDGTYFYAIELVGGQTLTGWIYINRER